MAEKSTDPRITNRAGKSSRNALIVALVAIVGVSGWVSGTPLCSKHRAIDRLKRAFLG